MTMHIRQARSSDIDLILSFMGKRPANRRDWHIPAKKFVASYIRNKHNFFLICIDQKRVVGSIAGELWNDKGFAYVGEITAKGKDESKIIRGMFGHFVKFCKKKGVTLINTYVKVGRDKAISTYKKVGMEKRGNYFYYERQI